MQVTSLTNVGGATVESPPAEVSWMNRGGLWVAVQESGADSGAPTATFEVIAEIPNADGSPGARVSDTATG